MKNIANSFIFLLLMFFHIVYAAQNEITKILQHQKNMGHKIVFLCMQEPICKLLSDKKISSSQNVMTFFIPKIYISNDDVRAMVKKIEQNNHADYTIHCAEVKKPEVGFKISIEYNPEKIVFQQESFDAISTQKGLIFAFYFKNILDYINLHHDGLLRYALNLSTKPRIMLDFGHGGTDEGKVGCYHIKEKDLTLAIGYQVAQVLKKKGYDVCLTRHDDSFVALDERTTLANKLRADLFVSIHANSANNNNVTGIETYWTSHYNIKSVIKTDQKAYQDIYNLAQQLDILSKQCAHHIHQSVINAAQKIYPVQDRKIKESVAQVLLGIDMPGTLIELGFLSNAQETMWLIDPSYQKKIARAISEGIDSYFSTIFHQNS